MGGSAFIDTSGWYSLIDMRDAGHDRIAALVTRLIHDGVRLVTTDYVLDESVTLAKARSGPRAALRLLEVVEQSKALELEWIGSERFERAKELYRQYHDQGFSFTDCTSFAVMRERGLKNAITSDQHFRIAGFDLLPGS